MVQLHGIMSLLRQAHQHTLILVIVHLIGKQNGATRFNENIPTCGAFYISVSALEQPLLCPNFY